MLRKTVVALLLLMAPGWCYAQKEVDVGTRPTSDQVLSAEQIISKAKDDPVKIPYGGYALARITYTGKLKYYTVPGSDKCLKTQIIPKGTTYEGFLVPDGSTEYVDTIIPADPKYDRLLIRGVKPSGMATVLWIANGKTLDDEPVVVDGYQFIVGSYVPPKPIDPTPPVPPKPVDPVNYTGLRVVLVYESEDKLTDDQRNALSSPKVRAYLDSHATKDEKGKPSWRKWDKDVILGDDVPKSMRELWTAAKPKLGPMPQIVIVTDQKGETFALPANEQALLDLLTKYGGK